MKLLLDVGNSRLKWRLAEAGAIVAAGACGRDRSPAADWVGMPVPSRVYGCSVADAETQAALQALSGRLWGLAVDWLAVAPPAGGVRTDYDAGRLGPDRWASVVAAHRRAGGAALAVNAGTAVTVDAVDGAGLFRGGIILPGLGLMLQALARNTARLPEQAGRFADFPSTTVDALETGRIDAVCGAIERVYRRAGGTAAVYLSGGDAARLLPHLALPAIHVDNLVLDGLEVLFP